MPDAGGTVGLWIGAQQVPEAAQENALSPL